MESTTSRALLVTFPDLSPAEANRAAAGLDRRLRKITGGLVAVQVRRRDESDTMDGGSILAVLLGAKAVVTFSDQIARGIRDYVARINSRIEIVTEQGKVIARGDAATNLDTASVIDALKSHNEQGDTTPSET